MAGQVAPWQTNDRGKQLTETGHRLQGRSNYTLVPPSRLYITRSTTHRRPAYATVKNRTGLSREDVKSRETGVNKFTNNTWLVGPVWVDLATAST